MELNAKSTILQLSNLESRKGVFQVLCSFSVYVNNLPDCVSEGEVNVYDDDTTACVIGDSVGEVTLKFN